MDFCRENHIAFLIARCYALEIRAVQAMEREGFLLMDTLIYYTRNLNKTPIPSDTGTVLIRPIRPGEEEAVKAAAAESFRGYYGHYHSDDKLDSAKCDEAYTSWAIRSCTLHDVADEVLIAEEEGSILGFATLRLNSPDSGEGILFGVIPSAREKSIYKSFMIHGMKWCLSKGATRMTVSTQINNIAVQKVWVRLGFEPEFSYYTFHKWFEN